MAFALTIAQGKGRGRRFRFGSDGVSIGRAPGNDVVLNHAAVSRVRGSDATNMDVALSEPPVICHSPSCRP